MNSESATDGQVATADGLGGVSFEDVNLNPKITFGVKTSNQSVTGGSGDNEVVFDTEMGVDNTGYLDTSTGRITPTLAGFYEVTVFPSINPGSSGQFINYNIRKNNDTTTTSQVSTQSAANGNGFRLSGSMSAIFEMNGTTDYISFFTSSSISFTVGGSVARSYILVKYLGS